jgi:peptidyl-dipeptidase A
MRFRRFAERSLSPTNRVFPAALLALAILAALLLAAPDASAADADKDAREFLDLYTSIYKSLYTIQALAEWDASTDVSPEHDGARIASGKAFSAMIGDRAVIEKVRALRAQGDKLDPITRRQLEKIWLGAAHAPGTIPDVVSAKVEAESRARSALDGFQFCLERVGDSCVKPVTANDIDEILEKSQDLKERERAWKAAKETGPALKPHLVELQKLRNQVAREMGYNSYFDLEVADYGMTVPEMMALLEGFYEIVLPLYTELHTWAKYRVGPQLGNETAQRAIPAHWLGNRWGQNWPGLVESANLDTLFAQKSPEWIIQQAERFYTSMGFPPLPATFWTKSDLYPVPADSARKKNTHASAWHLDLESDLRSLMSVTPNDRWFGTTHHELGHIYYYVCYSRPEVPPILREGANRAFHEGIGELIDLASHQVPYLEEIGLLEKGKAPNQTDWLLDQALGTIVFIPWSAGVMSHWEHDLYEQDLPPSEWNARWWHYVTMYQGIVPPEPRGEEFCDACTKTHIIDDPAGYYDYAIATVLKHQLHDHIARKILKQDPHSANYYNNKEVGAFLRGILEQGATRDWRVVLREATGEDLSTRAMVEYYAPLLEWLQKENEGRLKGWTSRKFKKLSVEDCLPPGSTDG